jgi:hypothetical protein
MTRIVLALFCAFSLVVAFGCDTEEEAATEETTADTPPPVGEADDPEPADEPAAGGGGVCDKAADCCQAYINALPGGGAAAASTCDTIASVRGTPAADASCQQMIDTWKQSLQGMSIDVPSACN